MVKASKYIESVGRRKTAVARVRMTPSAKTELTVNDKNFSEYFTVARLRHSVKAPLEMSESQKFSVTAKVDGGGIMAQAEAVRHGIARALVLYDENLRSALKKAGYLKRDPRAVERKKFGLKKARRAPQWSKR